MGTLNRIKQIITWKLLAFRIWVRGVQISLMLSIRTIPDWIGGRVFRFRNRMTVRRGLATVVMIAAFLTPTVLYLHERSVRIDKEKAYQDLFMTTVSETQFLRSSMQSLLKERALLRGRLIEAGVPVCDDDGNVFLKLVATGYSSSIFETDDTPFITAANTHTRPGIVAMSRDLLRAYTPNAPFHFGDRIHIAGLGEFIVEDSMNRRWRKRMDIWFPSRKEAFDFGKRNLYISKLANHKEILDEFAHNNGALQ
jgi:3D (Asp-Asp-Asp) domain-containing protein